MKNIKNILLFFVFCLCFVLSSCDVPVEGTDEAKLHNVLHWEIVDEVGCEKDGYRFGMCIDCLNEIRDIQKAKGHDYRNGACVRCGAVVPSEDSESFGYFAKYELEPGGKGYALISAGKFSGKAAVIPEEHEGLPVVKIGEWAFYSTVGVEEIIIPDSVEIIMNGAFSGCEKLERITIGKSVVSLGERAFEKCINLREVILPSTLEIIGSYCFVGCEKLANVRADGCVQISSYAFKDCEMLHEFNFPKMLKQIGEGAFESSGLVSADLPESVIKIGRRAFAGSALQTVTLPSKITDRTESLFDGCNSLRIATLKTNLIRQEFSGCKNLEAIIFTDDVIAIHYNSIASSCGAKTLYFPKGIHFMYFPISECRSLETLVYAGTAKEFLAISGAKSVFELYSNIKIVCTDKVLVKSDIAN